MQFRSSASTLFSIRELRRLQRLYRSRELTQQRSALRSEHRSNRVFHPVSNQASPDNGIHYLIYGGRGMLSPTQRTLLRTHLGQFDAFKSVSVKLSLFPTSISQPVRVFSHLQEARSLLKGSSYQRSIQVLNTNTSTSSANVSSYGHVHHTQNNLQAFFDYLKTARFSEESTREFSPSLIFAKHSWSSMSPRRLNQLTPYFSWGLSHQELLYYQSAILNSPAVSVVAYILYRVVKRQHPRKA